MGLVIHWIVVTCNTYTMEACIFLEETTLWVAVVKCLFISINVHSLVA